MKARDVIQRLLDKSIIKSDLRYCLVDENKHPFKIDTTPARPNVIEDFVDFETLKNSENIDVYAGIGISIQASNVSAIDVDKCFSIPNDINSGDERAKYFLDLFKDDAYCEFSFSGTGLRIIFKQPLIENYSDKYYIKNEKYKLEYYQPNKSYRYVTVTGNCINDKNIDESCNLTNKIYEFLDKYMKRPVLTLKVNTEEVETRTYEELMKLVKVKYLKDIIFQNLWFNNAPGSGKDESERDYHLVVYLYQNITQDKDLLKKIFESSPFFKSKDNKHVYKWNYNNFRYFNYIYNNVKGRI